VPLLLSHPKHPVNLERNDHQSTSRCSTAYSYVELARDAGPTRHATFQFYTTAFDASADRQEAFHGGASRYRALQTYPSGRGHWRRAVEGVSACTRRVRPDREDAPARQCAFGIRGRQDTVSRTSETAEVTADRICARYDYDEDKRKLVIRMPTEIHERFIDKVEDNIRSQLKTIQNGSGKKAEFAQNVHPARSTHIRLGTSTSSKSKYEPDASFRHKGAQYPGVIVEVAYSQKKPRLDRLAENYILDSDASIRAVICVHIEYGNKKSRKATLSVWRPKLFTIDDVLELRAVEEVADVVGPITSITFAVF